MFSFGERTYSQLGIVEVQTKKADLEEIIGLGEDLVCHVVESVLARRREELDVLERDITKLEKIQRPFVRMTHDKAVEFLREKGHDIEWGGDLGAQNETTLGEAHDRPVVVTHYPTAMKAFYMQPDAQRPEVALCVDVLAPEGYGEIIGGGQRIHDLELLRRRIREHDLPEDAFSWYLDLRRYGSVPHSGFGMGIERVVG